MRSEYSECKKEKEKEEEEAEQGHELAGGHKGTAGVSTRLGDTATSTSLISGKQKNCQAKKSHPMQGWTGDSEQCSCQGSTGEDYQCNFSESQIAGKADFMATEPAPPLH